MARLYPQRALLLPAVIMVCSAMQTVGVAGQPIALHPDNSHYFIWKNRPTVLITSGEHYGALLNLDFDYERYFDELQVHDLNHTRIFAGTYREIDSSFRITNNPLAPKQHRYIAPWARSDQAGYAGGGNKFDLTKWDNAYFSRLRDLMRAAQQRGIIVELTLFCPMYKDELWGVCPMNSGNNINGIGDCPREEAFTLRHNSLVDVHVAVTQKIVRELRDFDNLYYEVCNEPYFGGVTMEWQHKIVDTITDMESEFDAKHLISMNVANGRKKVVDPHPAVSIFNFHYCVPPDTVAMNHHLNKVIGENETGFRGRDDVLYRTEAWDFLVAGGGLYNNLDYSFTPSHPDGSFTDYRSPGGGSRALRRQLRILKRFFDEIRFTRMKPDSSVILRIDPELTASALVEPGKAWAMYLHTPLPNKPKDLKEHLREDINATFTIDLPAGRYEGEWIDTKTGRATELTLEHEGGHRQLTTPRFDNDIALRIKRIP